jgi:hypothetical protein
MARKQQPQIYVRLSPENQRLVEALKQSTNISISSQLVLYALQELANARGVKLDEQGTS